MKSLLVIFQFLNIYLSIAATTDDPTDTINIIEKYGYPYEKHNPVTEDGYILSLIRIPHGKTNATRKNVPVLLLPGMLACAGEYVLINPNRSLGYILADNGYDVWLLNPRGTVKDAQRHLYIDEKTNKQAYYNYSWHEIGIYDNPATIDYVLNHTNKDKLHYIGHSLAGAAFLVMASERPEYNDKIQLASLLAPAAYLETTSFYIELVAPFSNVLTTLLNLLQIYDIPYTAVRTVLKPICSHWEFNFFCFFVYNYILGFGKPDPSQIDSKNFEAIFSIIPSGTSMKDLYHYLQIIKAKGRFQQYDYGREENLKRYNSVIPPAYNVGKITAPIAIYIGKNDMFVGTTNAERTLSNLRGRQNPYYYVVPHNEWDHGDFIFAKDVVSLLYNEVLRMMSNHEN